MNRPRGLGLGVVAGFIGLSCCVYPVVLALLGLATASAAVDLGNSLYREWGWAFRGAAIIFVVAALLIQRRRARSCPIDERPDLRRTALWIVGTGVITYAALYAVTTGLGLLA